MSFSGKCCDSPLEVSRELYKKAPWLIQNWIVNPESVGDVPEYAKIFIFGTKEGKKAINTSEVIVDNVYGPYSTQVFNNFK